MFSKLRELVNHRLNKLKDNYPIPISIFFPIPIEQIPVPVTQPHFSREKTGQSQLPFYPFRTLMVNFFVEFGFQQLNMEALLDFDRYQ